MVGQEILTKELRNLLNEEKKLGSYINWTQILLWIHLLSVTLSLMYALILTKSDISPYIVSFMYISSLYLLLNDNSEHLTYIDSLSKENPDQYSHADYSYNLSVYQDWISQLNWISIFLYILMIFLHSYAYTVALYPLMKKILMAQSVITQIFAYVIDNKCHYYFSETYKYFPFKNINQQLAK